MEEKLIPDVQSFAQEIQNELRQDLPTQRIKIAERLMNLPPEKFSELHLQDWYNVYWKFLDIFQYIDIFSPPPPPIHSQTFDLTENVCNKIMQFAEQEYDPVRLQYFALALLLMGKRDEFQTLKNEELWPPKLREDFELYSKFDKLINKGPSLKTRISVRRKQMIKDFIKKKYSRLSEKYLNFVINSENCPRIDKKDYKIWYLWLQGKNEMPPTVKVAYNSLKKNAGSYELVFLDKSNLLNYITLPEHILKKFNEGKMTITHLSDIIRVTLLEKYGGLWTDSTILATEPLEKYEYLWKKNFYTRKIFQTKDEAPYDTNISHGRWAGFIMGTSILHNPLFMFMKELFNAYWEEFDFLFEFFLIDYYIDLAYDTIPFVRREIDDVPRNNVKILNLFPNLNSDYHCLDDGTYKDTFLHKLSRIAQLDMSNPNTVFRELQRRYTPEDLK